jgi:hypothetical protein
MVQGAMGTLSQLSSVVFKQTKDGNNKEKLISPSDSTCFFSNKFVYCVWTKILALTLKHLSVVRIEKKKAYVPNA